VVLEEHRIKEKSMAISSKAAEKIHKAAQDAGIDDHTLQNWTEEEGGYRFAITGGGGAIKALQADAVHHRIKKYVADREHAVITEAAKAAGITPPPAPGTPMATPRQVDYIMSLLARRERSGEGGGFFQGPTDRDGIAALTKAEASNYIRSLKGDY
jgi:hypothetical protein